MQKGNGEPLTHLHLEDARLVSELSVQWSDGEREVIIPPFPITGRSRPLDNRNLWKISFPAVKSQIIAMLREKGYHGSNSRTPASFMLKTTFSSGGVSKESELVLLPLDLSSYGPKFMPLENHSNLNLQLTTSTRTPKVHEFIFGKIDIIRRP